MVIEYDELNKESITKGYSVVKFYATWCGPCKMLAPIFDATSNEVKDVVFASADIDKYREFAVEYRVKSVPTVLLLKDGIEIERFSGFQTKNFIIDWIGNNK